MLLEIFDQDNPFIFDSPTTYYISHFRFKNDKFSSLFTEKYEENFNFLNNLCGIKSTSYSSLLYYQAPQVKNLIDQHIGFSHRENSSESYKIVDATSHIGGDAIHFSKIFDSGKILCLDTDQEALDCLKINISNYSDLSRFEIVKDDCVNHIKTYNPKAFIYYFDPPWGGPLYYNNTSMYLYLKETPIDDIINYVFLNNLTEYLILKTPRNFDYKRLQNELLKNLTITIGTVKKTKKEYTAYYLLFITKLI